MNIFLFEQNPGLAENLQDNLPKEHKVKKVLTKEEDLLQALQAQKIDVLIINIKEITEPVQTALKGSPVYVIVISSEATADTFKKSLALGVKDFLTLPVQKNELGAALGKAQHFLANIRAMQQAAPQAQAKIATFLSSKGGVGKSLLAANLAFYLQKEMKHKVLLIDAVPRFGNLDILLDLNEKRSIQLIAGDLKDPGALWEDIEDNLQVHASGLSLLVAGDKTSEAVTPQKLKSILAAAKDKFDFIIIDTENCFSDLNLSLLEISDLVFFVSTFDIAAIKNLNLGLEAIKALYFSTDKIKIVVNRFDATNELTVPEMEKYLKFKVSVLVPEDRPAIIRSINQGVPFIAAETVHPALVSSIKYMTECLQGKTCQLRIPEISKENGSGWLKNFVHIFGEK